MKLNSITVKLGGTILILFLIVLFPLIYTIDQLFSSYFYSQKMEQIDFFATKYSETITDVNDKESYHMFEMISELNNVDLFIFNNKGVILNSTGLLNFKEGKSVGEIIKNPIMNKQHLSIEYNDSKTSQTYLISGEPILINNRVSGGLIVVSNMESINTSIAHMRSWLMISVIGSLLIAIGFTFFISRKLSAPLLKMVHATREIATGPLKTGLSITSNDEIGTLAKAINELGRELEDFRSNRREFFANISHELRTPISYIKGYSHVLKNSLYRNEEEKKQYLDIINDEATRLTTLINDLFELSKMEEGRLELNIEALDITNIVISSINKVNLKANEKKIKIISDLPITTPLFHTDGYRLEQVLINLLENAIRYSDDGSAIMVKVTNDQNYLYVSIVDQGVGIPENDLPYIFQRFYRVEKSRTRVAGGTGLGLAIVKNIIDLLSGHIEVQSVSGAGTTFKITFPLKESGDEDE